MVTRWLGFEGVALLKDETCHWGWYALSQAQSLSLPPTSLWTKCKVQLLLQGHSCLSEAMWVLGSASETLSKLSIACFLLWVTLVTVSLYSNKKVTKFWFNKKHVLAVIKTAQWVKVLVTKPDYLSAIPGTHTWVHILPPKHVQNPNKQTKEQTLTQFWVTSSIPQIQMQNIELKGNCIVTFWSFSITETVWGREYKKTLEETILY